MRERRKTMVVLEGTKKSLGCGGWRRRGGSGTPLREPQCPPLPKIPVAGCVEEGGQRDSVEGSPVCVVGVW